MNIIKKQSTAILSFIPIFILAFSFLISGCGGGTTAGLSLVGGNNPGDNPGPISPIDLIPSNPPPPAPVITTAEATTNSVYLKWMDESPREFGFLIIRDGVQVGETDKNISQWTDSSVLPDTTYLYVVVAWNKEGSNASQEKTVMTPAVPVPKLVLPLGAKTRLVATDQATGDVYASGMTYDSLPGFTNAGGTDVFLAKFNPDGTLSWLEQWGTADNDFDVELKVLGGKAYVSWGTDPYLISVHGSRISVFGNGGEILWSFALPGIENVAAIALTGDMFYVFQSSSALLFGIRIHKLDPETGLIIEMYDEPRWEMNNVVTNDTAMHGFVKIPGGGPSFIGKYDFGADDFLWLSSLWDDGGPSMEAYFDIAANPSGVYVGGWWGFNSIIPPEYGGGSDPPRCLLFRYDAQGNFLWAHQDARAGYFWRVVSNDSAAYALGVPNSVCGLTKILNDGTVVWQTSVVGQSLALFNNVLYVAKGHTNTILRYDALTGSALP